MGRPATIAVTRRRYRIRRLAWVAALALIAIVFAAWFRDSGLVAVKHVRIEGIGGREADRVRFALEGAARDMTTLHVRTGDLRTAVEPYPSVASIDVKRGFPNTLTIVVHSREPVAAIAVGSTRVAVSADGVLLRGSSPRGVPLVPLRMPPTGTRVSGAKELQALAVLGAAPKPLRSKIERLRFTSNGIVVTLSKGPELRFGSAARPNAKWSAISRVLADDSSKGATYIDVHLPERPAAGGLEDPSSQHDPRTTDEATLPPSATTQTQPATTSPPPVATTPQPAASAPQSPLQGDSQ